MFRESGTQLREGGVCICPSGLSVTVMRERMIMALIFSAIIAVCLSGPVTGQVFVQQQYPYQQPYVQPSYGIESYRYVNPYLLRQYRSAQDFYASSRQDLDRKVNDAAELLNELRQNMNSLLVDARNRGDTFLQNALYRVDAAATDVVNFQRQLTVDRTTPFQQLDIDWRTRIQSMFDNGLYAIVRAAEMYNSATNLSSTGFLYLVSMALSVLFAYFI